MQRSFQRPNLINLTTLHWFLVIYPKRLFPLYTRVHAKSSLKGVKTVGVQPSVTRDRNTLICLNMHAVEVRRGDTGHIQMTLESGIWGGKNQRK